jgi:hypothetical protein
MLRNLEMQKQFKRARHATVRTWSGLSEMPAVARERGALQSTNMKLKIDIPTDAADAKNRHVDENRHVRC